MSISANNVVVTYGKGESAVHALRGVSLTIPEGKWTTLMGPSGSGKTTLLHCLAGLSTPTSGTVTLNSRGKKITVSGLSENERAKLRRTNIGLIFQDFNLVPVLNVADNIKLPMRLAHNKIDSGFYKQVVDVLGLGSRLKHLPHELSGGQRQRVAIARALLSKPDIMFADEPTGALDSETGNEVLTLFRMVVDQLGQTLVMVTHDESAAARGDYVIRMRDGQIVGR